MFKLKIIIIDVYIVLALFFSCMYGDSSYQYAPSEKGINFDGIRWKTLLETATHRVTDWFEQMKSLDAKLGKNKQYQLRQGKNMVGNTQTVGHRNDLSPNDYRIIFSGRTDEVDELAHKAFVGLEMASMLVKSLNISAKSASVQLEKFDLPDYIVREYCPFNEYRLSAGQHNNFLDHGLKNVFFRSPDGSFNNPFDPYKGRSNTPFYKLISPQYADGVQALRLGSDGFPLPSARKVTTLIHRWPYERSSRSTEFSRITMLMTMWGQLLSHDFGQTPLAKVPGSKCCNYENRYNPNCAVIDVEIDDPFYGKYETTCMEFTRSSPSFRRDCKLGPKEILNGATSFLDASVAYGSSERKERQLRSHINGEFRVRNKQFFHDTSDFMPLHPNGTQETCVDELCYFAGDPRVNENPGLTALHNLLVREHNRVARELHWYNPHWDDERIFQEAKRIVIAEHQHITYNEYISIVVGKKLANLYPDVRISLEPGYYNGYSPDVDPGTSQVFTSSAFRFGHSMVSDKLVYAQNDGHGKSSSSFTYFRESYFRPQLISGNRYPETPDNLLRGLAIQKAYIMDNWVSRELVDHLYQTKPSAAGLDLMSMTIQRGRDVGVAGYNEWRKWCGLKPFSTFEELAQIMPFDLVAKFKALYASVDDIDLISAADSEYWLYDAIVGPTFACLLIEQFIRTRKGDRFWYENGPISYGHHPIHTHPFTLAQLAEIKKITIAKLVCNNSPLIKELQPRAFLSSDHYTHNQPIPCYLLPPLDLSLWKEL